MTDVNKEELRRLAEDCVAFEHSWPSEKAEKTELFRDKANPETVIALLDELEEDRGAIAVWRGRTQRAEAERDALRAERDELRFAMVRAMLCLEEWNRRYPRLAARGAEGSSQWAERELRRMLPGYREAMSKGERQDG